MSMHGSFVIVSFYQLEFFLSSFFFYSMIRFTMSMRLFCWWLVTLFVASHEWKREIICRDG